MFSYHELPVSFHQIHLNGIPRKLGPPQLRRRMRTGYQSCCLKRDQREPASLIMGLLYMVLTKFYLNLSWGAKHSRARLPRHQSPLNQVSYLLPQVPLAAPMHRTRGHLFFHELPWHKLTVLCFMPTAHASFFFSSYCCCSMRSQGFS